jgi:hypothetical protein
MMVRRRRGSDLCREQLIESGLAIGSGRKAKRQAHGLRDRQGAHVNSLGKAIHCVDGARRNDALLRMRSRESKKNRQKCRRD